MLPWLGVLAGTLAAKMGSADKRKAAAGEILAKNAARMGADTSMIDASVANKQIQNQESQALSNLFIQQLVGKLGPDNYAAGGGTEVTQDKLGGMVGNTGLQQGPAGGLVPAYGMKSSLDDEELRKSWRR